MIKIIDLGQLLHMESLFIFLLYATKCVGCATQLSMWIACVLFIVHYSVINPYSPVCSYQDHVQWSQYGHILHIDVVVVSHPTSHLPCHRLLTLLLTLNLTLTLTSVLIGHVNKHKAKLLYSVGSP